MLKNLKRRQARFIALLAKAARQERDALLGDMPEKELGEIRPSRGDYNPTAALGFEPLPAGSPQVSALRNAIDGLIPAARMELYSLMRVGQGQFAAKDWDRAISEAELLGSDTVSASLSDDVDLFDHLEKGIYKLHLAA